MTQQKLKDIETLRESSKVVSSRDLSVDWSVWEQHVFFGSAQARLNSAREFILESYPFDGTRADVDAWRSGLNGWQDWLLHKSWTYNLRSLKFESVLPLPGGVNPLKPPAIPSIYTVDFRALRDGRRTGDSPAILNPRENPLTVEFWLKIPETTETGLRPLSAHRSFEGEGWTILFDVQASGFRLAGDLVKATNSDDWVRSYGQTQYLFNFDQWHHVSFSWSSADAGRELTILVDGEVQPLSGQTNTIQATDGLWSTEAADPHWIGWAPDPNLDATTSYLSFDWAGGFLLDEYRIWHVQRSSLETELSRFKNLWKQDGLVLQYRFNDSPQTALLLANSGSSVLSVLDTSGNALHGQRQAGTLTPEPELALERPQTLQEREEHHPCIYPPDTALEAVLSSLRASGREYDNVNPNLITRLVPQHYFNNPLLLPKRDIQSNSELAEIEDGSFLLAAVLYTWADFWDDLKVRGDSLVGALSLKPDGTGSARPILPLIAKELGTSLPMIFEELLPSAWDENFEKIQEDVWRRVLLALPSILKRKGTTSGIRSLFSALGSSQVNSAIRLREYGSQVATTSTALTEVEQTIRFARFTTTSVKTKLLADPIAPPVPPDNEELFIGGLGENSPEIVTEPVPVTRQLRAGIGHESTSGTPDVENAMLAGFGHESAVGTPDTEIAGAGGYQN